MKSLKESIFSDVEDIVNSDSALIEQFINDNYEIDGTYIIEGSYTIKDGVVDVKGSVGVKNVDIKSLTNGTFRFGTVVGDFYCVHCHNLKSLEGGPEKVGKNFNCVGCDGFKSLEGVPKEVA